mmetsp:Transcript_16170/g.34310  ORF Transcript_16170/g.34310 Transcript_16170/m.34310 type:complete len:154 (-) Transcript_16170:72-533(-)
MAGVWHNTANRGFFYGPSSNNPWNNDIGWKDSVAKESKIAARFAENQVPSSSDHRKSTGKMSVNSRVTNTSSASLDSGRFRLSTRQAAILQELDRLNKDEQMMVLRDAIGHKLSATEQISLLRDTLREVDKEVDKGGAKKKPPKGAWLKRGVL